MAYESNPGQRVFSLRIIAVAYQMLLQPTEAIYSVGNIECKKSPAESHG